MRHILVHVYYDIDADLVWRVTANELTPLLSELKLQINKLPATPTQPLE